MSLVAMKELVNDAYERKYAVGAFNATDLNTVRGIVRAAEKANSPIILQFAESHAKYISLEMAGEMYKYLAEKAKVPIAVHLDHGESYGAIIQAMYSGYTSVMVDSSTRPFEENVEKTKEIVKIAHELGISVESELGIMNAEDGTGNLDYNHLDSTYTNPADAEKFVKLTNVDALAVAFGTVHGLYAKEPKLNFERLAEIKEATMIPLVMHGGSGLKDIEYKKAIENGIAKINYYSTMSYEATCGLRKYLTENKDAYLFDVDMQIIDLVEHNIFEKLNVFGSVNKG